MAPITGGGPPLGSGNSFTGTSQGLEVIGDHCYAYSRTSTSAGTGADTTALLFTTGSYYSVFDYIGFVNTENASNVCYVEMFMNNSEVFVALYNNPQDMRDDQPVKLIIPPNTQFEFKVGQTSGGTSWSIIMTGRIYR